MGLRTYKEQPAEEMASMAERPRPDPAVLAELSARIQRIGRQGRISDGPVPAVPLGIEAIDSALPWGGLPRGGLHEIAAADVSAAAAGFCAMVLARLAGDDGAVAWCRPGAGSHNPGLLYGPGLVELGLDLRRLIVVRARREAELLWVLEEGLRSGALAAVAGETATLQPVALRRLQLAAESTGTAALLLRPRSAQGSVQPAATPAVTRWRVGTAPAQPPPRAAPGVVRPPGGGAGGRRVRPRWSVELVRCRTGVPGPPVTVGNTSSHRAWSAAPSWLLEGCDETGGFVMAAELQHRSPEPAEAEPAEAEPARARRVLS